MSEECGNSEGRGPLNQWGRAITAWFDRQHGDLVDLIKDPTQEIPDFAREFLADLVDGKVEHGRGGRPPKRFARDEREIVAECFKEWESTTKDDACAIVAERHELPDEAVRGLMDKFRKYGITKEAWIKWGRPAWPR
jgi:hypothetical protein